MCPNKSCNCQQLQFLAAMSRNLSKKIHFNAWWYNYYQQIFWVVIKNHSKIAEKKKHEWYTLNDWVYCTHVRLVYIYKIFIKKESVHIQQGFKNNYNGKVWNVYLLMLKLSSNIEWYLNTINEYNNKTLFYKENHIKKGFKWIKKIKLRRYQEHGK